MIKDIDVKNVASYDHKGITLNNLKEINFIYGSNGSGKTTISEFLRNSNIYPDCNLHKTDNEAIVLVYNRNFVKENFQQSKSIKGIFTLGENLKETMKQIDDYKDDIEKHRDKIDKLEIALTEVEKQQSALNDKFKEDCWVLKNNYGKTFLETFSGYGKSKDKFMKKIIEEMKSNQNSVKEFEQLISRRKSLFEQPLVYEELLNEVQFDPSIYNHSLLKSKIIGAKDVDIADLIAKLNISDWVLQGHNHIKNSEGICPFCQQTLPEELDKKLNQYFNQTYSQQIKELNDYKKIYSSHVEASTKHLDIILESNSRYLEIKTIEDKIQLVKLQHKENSDLIIRKLKEPSQIVTLHDISIIIEEINNEVKITNEKIHKQNNLVDNSKSAKKDLEEDIWKFLCAQISTHYQNFEKEFNQSETQIKNRKKQILNKKESKNLLSNNLVELQKKVTNIEHSVNEINKKLNSFGFTNFKLAVAKEEGYYKIIRETGEDVEDTLSEGEKTFITFLYFYSLLKGAISEKDISNNKIVVIDDPISSLDSNILFMVSSLINQLIEEITDGISDIKQLLVFTHNIYFYKEISFEKHSNLSRDKTFWILNKSDNKTSIQQYDYNPIKSSYELLWNELKLIKNQSLVTTQNVMRRILENYFTFFGGIKLPEIIDKFEEKDKPACKTLLSWSNDGSHHINEDLFIERSADVVEKYLELFKQIFYKMGHEAHYEMMMKDYKMI